MQKGLAKFNKPFVLEVGSSITRQFSVSIIGFLSTVVIAAAWGAAGNGWFFLAQFIPNLVFTIAAGGIPAAIIYTLSSASSTITSGSLLRWLLPRLPAMILGQWIVGGVYIYYFAESNLVDSVLALVIIALLTVFCTLKQVLLAWLQSRKEILRYNRYLAIEAFSTFFLLLAFSYLELPMLMGILAAVSLGLLSGFLLPVVGLLQHARQSADGGVRQSLFVSYSMRTYTAALLAFLNNRFSVLFTTSLFSVEALGFLSIAINLTEKILVISRSASISVFPRLAEDQGNSFHYTRIVGGVTFWLTMLAVVFLGLVVNILIEFFYGAEFSDVPQYVYIILPAIPFFALNRILAQNFAGMGKPELNAITTAIALVVNVALCFALQEQLGLTAVAVAISASMVANTVAKMIIYKTIFGQTVGPLFVPRIDFMVKYFRANEDSHSSK